MLEGREREAKRSVPSLDGGGGIVFGTPCEASKGWGEGKEEMPHILGDTRPKPGGWKGEPIFANLSQAGFLYCIFGGDSITFRVRQAA